jgi:hypothetical protein
MDSFDAITEAIQRDHDRRGYDDWVKRGRPDCPPPQPVLAERSERFWRDLAGIDTLLAEALRAITRLDSELEPQAPNLVAHLCAARECLAPLLRELSSRAQTGAGNPIEAADPAVLVLEVKSVVSQAEARRRDRELALQMAQNPQALLRHNLLAQALALGTQPCNQALGQTRIG